MTTDSPYPSSVAGATICRQPPKVGAECPNRARSDLCGGCPVTRIPTAITGLRRGYSGTANRKGRQQTNRTYCHRAKSRLYRSDWVDECRWRPIAAGQRSLSRAKLNNVGLGLTLGYSINDNINMTFGYKSTVNDSKPTDLRMDAFQITLVFGWHPLIEGAKRLKSE